MLFLHTVFDFIAILDEIIQSDLEMTETCSLSIQYSF